MAPINSIMPPATTTGGDANTEKISRCAKWGGVRRGLSESEALYECLTKIWEIHEREENAGNWKPGQSRPLSLNQVFSFDLCFMEKTQ